MSLRKTAVSFMSGATERLIQSGSSVSPQEMCLRVNLEDLGTARQPSTNAGEEGHGDRE